MVPLVFIPARGNGLDDDEEGGMKIELINGVKDENSIIHPDDLVVTGSVDGSAKIWMISKGECIHVSFHWAT